MDESISTVIDSVGKETRELSSDDSSSLCNHCSESNSSFRIGTYYPDAALIRLVVDNLNTHHPATLYETFEAKEANRILKRLEFHYTPKHASIALRAFKKG
jgi:hypothetical protein